MSRALKYIVVVKGNNTSRSSTINNTRGTLKELKSPWWGRRAASRRGILCHTRRCGDYSRLFCRFGHLDRLPNCTCIPAAPWRTLHTLLHQVSWKSGRDFLFPGISVSAFECVCLYIYIIVTTCISLELKFEIYRVHDPVWSSAKYRSNWMRIY